MAGSPRIKHSLAVLAGAAAFAMAVATTAAPARAAGFGTFFAMLNANGGVVRSSGVELATKMVTGKYEVTFNRDVATCASVVSVNGAIAGYGVVRKKSGTTDVLQISVFNRSGALADLPLTVFVLCNN